MFLNDTFSHIKEFIKKHQNDIMLFIVVFLISLLCFALGYLWANQQEKEPLRFDSFLLEESKEPTID